MNFTECLTAYKTLFQPITLNPRCEDKTGKEANCKAASH